MLLYTSLSSKHHLLYIHKNLKKKKGGGPSNKPIAKIKATENSVKWQRSVVFVTMAGMKEVG